MIELLRDFGFLADLDPVKAKKKKIAEKWLNKKEKLKPGKEIVIKHKLSGVDDAGLETETSGTRAGKRSRVYNGKYQETNYLLCSQEIADSLSPEKTKTKVVMMSGVPNDYQLSIAIGDKPQLLTKESAEAIESYVDSRKVIDYTQTISGDRPQEEYREVPGVSFDIGGAGEITTEGIARNENGEDLLLDSDSDHMSTAWIAEGGDASITMGGVIVRLRDLGEDHKLGLSYEVSTRQ